MLPTNKNNLEGTSQSPDTPQLELGKATSSTSSHPPMPRPAAPIPSASERPQGLRATQLTDVMPPTAPSSTTASAPTVMPTAPTIGNLMLEFLLPHRIKELENLKSELSNPNFENQNPAHIINMYKNIYSSVQSFLKTKEDLEKDRKENLFSYPEKTIKEIDEKIGKINEFERAYRTFCETNGKQIQEIIEMIKFIKLIDEMLQKEYPELNYEDFSQDLYFQAKQNLANENKNEQPHLIEEEVKNLIKRAKVMKKMFFGDEKQGGDIGKWSGLIQGYNVFYTEVSQRREENAGELVIWPSSKEPGQPDKYYISFSGHEEGPFTERELGEVYQRI